MAKGDQFYFDNLVAVSTLAEKAADYLVTCLENYNPEQLPSMIEEMHSIEHSADIKKHEMSEALAKAFVTPVDREDLNLLSLKLDDVVDNIEEVLQKFYIYDIRVCNADAVAFAKQIVETCRILVQITDQFRNFRKSKQLQPLLISLNDTEEACDRQHLSSMRALTLNEKDPVQLVNWRIILTAMEDCVDCCEDVAEAIESVIMKNT